MSESSWQNYIEKQNDIGLDKTLANSPLEKCVDKVILFHLCSTDSGIQILAFFFFFLSFKEDFFFFPCKDNQSIIYIVGEIWSREVIVLNFPKDIFKSLKGYET